MEPSQTSRRRFLARLGVGGVAIGVGLRTSGAAAQEDDPVEEAEETDHTDAAAVVESLELAAAAFYARAGAAGAVEDPATVAMFGDFARHHRAHADGFADIAGAKATGEPNERLLRTVLDQLDQKESEEEVLRLANDLETALTSTHLTSLGDVGDSEDSEEMVELLASVLPVEAQHATVAGRAAGVAAGRAVPKLENLDLALDVTQFPATTTTTTTP